MTRMQQFAGAILALSFAAMVGGSKEKQQNAAGPNAVTAIDILLEPDATMLEHAKAANALLLKTFPKGFALGKTHQPHVSCLQRFVRTADLTRPRLQDRHVLQEFDDRTQAEELARDQHEKRLATHLPGALSQFVLADFLNADSGGENSEHRHD